MAPSTVSVPLLQKKTRDRSPPAVSVSFSATSPLSRLQSMRTRLGSVAFEQLLEDRLDLRMIPAQRKDAPAGEQVEIFVPRGIPEIAPFAADVALVEADGAEHLDKRGVDVLGVQVVGAVAVLVEISEKVCVQLT